MGEVYRATDSKLDRDVAIKVMSEEFAESAERVARFEREAKALAKLNHPNIGTIHGFDQHEGKWFLVLELIEGETLSERLRTGPMPVDEALEVFKQIAEALEAAHEKHIVHRDLKPANVKIDPQGRVKVLDFGLAKARFSARPSADSNAPTADSDGPTITSEFTMPGKVMGTAAYMSPEQSRGQDVDRRTDVWAFGCCLYEALTGKKPFKGRTTSDLLADILRSDPDFTVVPPETPIEVLTLLRRCLEKDPQRRLRYLGDIAITLEEVTQTTRFHQAADEVPIPGEGNPAKNRRTLLGRKLAAVIGIGTTVVLANLALRQDRQRSQIRSIAVLPFKTSGSDTNLPIVAEGLAIEIREHLRRISALGKHVPSRAVAQYLEWEKTDKEIAAELQVDGLVYGTVVRIGEELSINVELVHGPTENSVWSTNLLSSNSKALQSQIVLNLLNQFQVSLRPEEQSFLNRPESVNIDAYTAFRKGLVAFDRFTPEGFKECEAFFREAIQLEPEYSAPYVALSWVNWVPSALGGTDLSPYQGAVKSQSILDEAALRFGEDHVQVLAERSWLSLVGGGFEWRQTRDLLRRARSADPNEPEVWMCESWFRAVVEGRFHEALEANDRAVAWMTGLSTASIARNFTVSTADMKTRSG